MSYQREVFISILMDSARLSEAYANTVFNGLKSHENMEAQALTFSQHYLLWGEAKKINPSKEISIQLSKMKETKDGYSLASTDETADFYDVSVMENGNGIEPNECIDGLENIVDRKQADIVFNFFQAKYPSHEDAFFVEA